jgi:adenosylmethionine-8-amino-7-oxononanoate aminotransferase
MKIWHPYTQEAAEPQPVPIREGRGVYLITEDGRRLIDAISSWWVNLHGHSHPVIAEAIAQQAARLEQVIFAGFTHEPAERLAGALAGIVSRKLSRLFFSDNGSTAVEVALKMAVQTWCNRGLPQKSAFVALAGAYHGDTVGAMSVSDDSPFTAAFGSLRIPVLRARDAAEVERIVSERKNEVAAVIVEPMIQGAGGMLVHSPESLKRIRNSCTKADALLIADEVFTGFGRTGRMFACEHADVAPDIMCLSKGLTGGFLPLAVTLCTEDIYSAFHSEDRSRTFFHGHSYSGNPLGCAAALANLQIFQTEPVFERIKTIESINRKRTAEITGHEAVKEVRMLGTIAALELKAEDAGYLSQLKTRLYAFYISRGVLLRPLGNVIYVVPPYVIAPDELNYVYDVIQSSLGLINSR